jgi:hypothetical protein
MEHEMEIYKAIQNFEIRMTGGFAVMFALWFVHSVCIGGHAVYKVISQ